jgi:hypothetical protein
MSIRDKYYIVNSSAAAQGWTSNEYCRSSKPFPLGAIRCPYNLRWLLVNIYQCSSMEIDYSLILKRAFLTEFIKNYCL